MWVGTDYSLVYFQLKPFVFDNQLEVVIAWQKQFWQPITDPISLEIARFGLN